MPLSCLKNGFSFQTIFCWLTYLPLVKKVSLHALFSSPSRSLKHSFWHLVVTFLWTRVFLHVHRSCCCCFVSKLYLTLCDTPDCYMPGFPVFHHLLEFAQTHLHWVGDAIQPSHPLSSPSPPAFSVSQHQGLFQWVSSSHQVANVLELQPQQWIFRVDFLWDQLVWSPYRPMDCPSQ